MVGFILWGLLVIVAFFVFFLVAWDSNDLCLIIPTILLIVIALFSPFYYEFPKGGNRMWCADVATIENGKLIRHPWGTSHFPWENKTIVNMWGGFVGDATFNAVPVISYSGKYGGMEFGVSAHVDNTRLDEYYLNETARTLTASEAHRQIKKTLILFYHAYGRPIIDKLGFEGVGEAVLCEKALWVVRPYFPESIKLRCWVKFQPYSDEYQPD